MDSFYKSDKNLRVMRNCVVALTVLVALIMTGIVVMLFILTMNVMSSFSYSYSYYGGYRYSSSAPSMVGWMWLLLIVCIALAVLVTYLTWQFGMFKVWKAYDIKMIRNKLYGVESSRPLAAFGMVPGRYEVPVQQPIYTPEPAYVPTPAPQEAPASDMVVCANCGATVRKSAFCGKCGSSME